MVILFALLGGTGFAQVDLGLPSGTKWYGSNQLGYYMFEDAVEEFGERLPNQFQWEELKRYCKWTFEEGDRAEKTGFRVTGPNGNSIFLPAAGEIVAYGNGFVVGDAGRLGYYWSSAYILDKYGWFFGIQKTSEWGIYSDWYDGNRRKGLRSVRLVEN